MKRSIVFYALAMAGLLFLLRVLDHRYLLNDLSTEFYVGFIALIFTMLGLWIGRMFTPKEAVESATSAPILVHSSRSDPCISPRENEVLRLIAAGHSNQEIADRLYLSLNTVKKAFLNVAPEARGRSANPGHRESSASWPDRLSQRAYFTGIV
jgi:two-component system, NarL family, response regulator LiaR